MSVSLESNEEDDIESIFEWLRNTEVEEVRDRETLIELKWAKQLLHAYYEYFDEIADKGLLRIHRDTKKRELVSLIELARVLVAWGDLHVVSMMDEEEAGEQ